MRVRVVVAPRAKKAEIIELQNGCLKVKLTSPPIKNRANRELIELLSHYYQVRKSTIRIIRGVHSREKLIEIDT
ncbi:hypothetical protein AMJ52_01970 [candidate division TA06 bacterium DG_78]|uniref:UPF0235 protein AMJ52_01970 n=1 Tax=candidate division TA06 bacterium DG_78 TaxID=1703772 RepID=A0A0S7YH68_UNCT6|nr:MAG: hypothetical protein AMJ52_01970 [candidate division TA06 bacterium DG_78]